MKNKISDLLFLIWPFCLIFGIFIFSFFPLYLFFLFLAISIFLFLAFIHHGSAIWRFGLAAIFISMGGISGHLARYTLPQMIEKSDAYDFQFMHVVQIEPKNGKKARYLLKLTDGRFIQITSSAQTENVKHCDFIHGRVFLNAPSQKLTPTGFNFYEYSRYKKIIAYGWSLSALKPAQKYEKNITCQINQLRYSIYQKLEKQFSDQALALSSALLIGYKAQIDDNVKTRFKSLGISHALVISGLHIGLVSLFFFHLLRFIFALIPPLYRYYNIKSLAAFFTIGIVVFYGLIAGYQAATLRACIMVIFGLMAIIAHRSLFSFRSFSLALMTILLINPYQIYMAGFQLSFLAVFGIILCHKLIFFKKRRWQNVFITAFIVLWLAPISLYYFGFTSFIGFAANLLILPLLTFIILPFLFLGFFIPLLWRVNNNLFVLFLNNIEKLNSENFILATVQPNLWAIISFYGVISLILIINIYGKKRIIFICLSIFLAYVGFGVHLYKQEHKIAQNILVYEEGAVIWRSSNKLHIHYFEDRKISTYKLLQIKQYYGFSPYEKPMISRGNDLNLKGSIWMYSHDYTSLNSLCIKADIVISPFDFRCQSSQAFHLKKAFSASFYKIKHHEDIKQMRIAYFND